MLMLRKKGEKEMDKQTSDSGDDQNSLEQEGLDDKVKVNNGTTTDYTLLKV